MSTTIVAALLMSAVAALLGKRTMQARIAYSTYLALTCIASVVAGSWIMYLING
jgi:hypothetical protein